jgi:hypothetical protein
MTRQGPIPSARVSSFTSTRHPSTRPLAGWTTLNYDPNTTTAWYGNLHLNNRYLTSASARRKTACHELGHAFGLGHRRTRST